MFREFKKKMNSNLSLLSVFYLPFFLSIQMYILKNIVFNLYVYIFFFTSAQKANYAFRGLRTSFPSLYAIFYLSFKLYVS